MADHGLPAQTRPVSYPFQASPSRYPAAGDTQRRDATASGRSALDAVTGIISATYEWYNTPCPLPQHPREALLKTAITIIVMLAFLALCRWLAALWRIRSSVRTAKKQ